MIGGFTQFGFDLFGLGKRVAGLEEARQPVPALPDPRPQDPDDDRQRRQEEPSEAFFWGMYPIY